MCVCVCGGGGGLGVLLEQEEHVFVLLGTVHYLSEGEGVGHKMGGLEFSW